MFLKIWEKHDHEKILFATDSQWGNATKNIEQVKELPLTEEENEAIFSGNAKNLL